MHKNSRHAVTFLSKSQIKHGFGLNSSSENRPKIKATNYFNFKIFSDQDLGLKVFKIFKPQRLFASGPGNIVSESEKMETFVFSSVLLCRSNIKK